MAKSFRSLTILLGKLGIAKHKFVTDWDDFATFIHGNKHHVMPRPPTFKSGIEYGVGLAEAVAWTRRYLAAREASTAVTTLSSVRVSEDESGSV
jgi:hypothetical protein